MTVAHLPTRPAKSFDPATEVHVDDVLDTWHVFSLTDVLRVLTDDEHFSAGYGLTDETRPLANPVLSGLSDELRADPSLIPGAVEETMRWYPA